MRVIPDTRVSREGTEVSVSHAIAPKAEQSSTVLRKASSHVKVNYQATPQRRKKTDDIKRRQGHFTSEVTLAAASAHAQVR